MVVIREAGVGFGCDFVVGSDQVCGGFWVVAWVSILQWVVAWWWMLF